MCLGYIKGNVSAATCQLLGFFFPVDVAINDISQVLVSLVVIFYLPHPALPSWVTRMPFWQDVQTMINKVGKTIHINFKQYWQLKNRIKTNFSFIKGKPLWVTFLAKTSKDLEIILITTVLSFTNSLSRTSLYFSLKTSFVYSNLFSLAKTVTIRCYIQTSKRVRSPSSACKKARATA